jgi:hypothetical protein
MLPAVARKGAIVAAHDAVVSVSHALAMTQPCVLPWTPASEMRLRRGCDDLQHE